MDDNYLSHQHDHDGVNEIALEALRRAINNPDTDDLENDLDTDAEAGLGIPLSLNDGSNHHDGDGNVVTHGNDGILVDHDHLDGNVQTNATDFDPESATMGSRSRATSSNLKLKRDRNQMTHPVDTNELPIGEVFDFQNSLTNLDQLTEDNRKSLLEVVALRESPAITSNARTTADSGAALDQNEHHVPEDGWRSYPGWTAFLENSCKQVEVVSKILAEISSSNHSGSGLDRSIDLGSIPNYIHRSEYDALKAKYDALVLQTPHQQQNLVEPEPTTKRSKRRRQQQTQQQQPKQQDQEQQADSTHPVAIEHLSELDTQNERQGSSMPVSGVSAATGEERNNGRKKRSIKLEHMIHKHANARLGVEYQVSQFETSGTSFLPSPDSDPPGPEESINGIQEYRPDFLMGDVKSPSVQPFIEKVIEDVLENWQQGDVEIDRDLLEKSVAVYWTRLCKRYSEQQSRERGEVHKDELTRRKQNQYRRQQSLLARRQAAFDGSPLNLCKLRALYRTILTIDFAASTNERPDPGRRYSPEEWEAYRKLQLGGKEGHEVVDLFWISPVVRNLLAILDVSGIDQASRLKRKGRPKAPAETFHLPRALWDRSTLPILRVADYDGLPKAGAPGIVLYKFHVDESVQAEFPEWASGLYDNPPIPAEDSLLPSLKEVLTNPMFAPLIPGIQKATQIVDKVPDLSSEDVEKINNTQDLANLDLTEFQQSIPISNQSSSTITDSSKTKIPMTSITQSGNLDNALDITSTEFMTRNLDSFVALAEAQNRQHQQHLQQASSSSDSPSTTQQQSYNYLFDITNLPTALPTGMGPPNPPDTVAATQGEASASVPSTMTHRIDLVPPNATPVGRGNLNMDMNMHMNLDSSLRGVGMGIVDPESISKGTSARARKMGKRGILSEIPGGALMPVPKRRKGEDASIGVGTGEMGHQIEYLNGGLEIQMDLDVDADFLMSLQ